MARIIIVRSSGGPELEVDQAAFNNGFFPGYVYVRDASGSPTNQLAPLAADMNTVLSDPASAPSTTLRAAYGAVTLVNATGTTDSAAIQAAFNGMKVGGHAQGHLLVKGIAALDTPLVLDGGYTDVANSGGGNWVGESGTFRFTVLGALTPAAGIGTAVTVKGFRGATADVNFRGGGNSSDVGLHLENLIDADVSAAGNGFAGTVLHADATGDATKSITQSTVRRLHAQQCGQALFWKGINAFGTFNDVWDNNCTNGSVFDTCADTTIHHWETFTPATQAVGLLFNACGNFHVDTLTMGDRPTEAIVKIVGGDFGRVSKIRVTGQPGITTPTVSGLKLVDVKSLTIGQLMTARCAKGLHIQGGGGAANGSITVQSHRSLTTDINPLYVEGGTLNTPIIDVTCAYRNHKAQSVVVANTITGGELKLRGLIDTPNSDGNAGVYAIDCAATAMIIDVTGLEQLNRAILAGSINHPTLDNIRGVQQAKLGNTLKWGPNPATTLPASPNGARRMVVDLVVNCTPASGQDAFITIKKGPDGATMPVVLREIRKLPTGATADNSTFCCEFTVPPYWSWSTSLANATIDTTLSTYYYE